MAIAKKPTRSTDPNVRKSPPFSASQFLVGHISVGNDGNNWIIVESANGVKRWAPYKKSASTAKATSSTQKAFIGISQTASQEDAVRQYELEAGKKFTVFYTLPQTNIPVFLSNDRNIDDYSFVVAFRNQNFLSKLDHYLKQYNGQFTNVRVNSIRYDILLANFEFPSHLTIQEKKDALKDIDGLLYGMEDVRNGIQQTAIMPATQTSSFRFHMLFLI